MEDVSEVAHRGCVTPRRTTTVAVLDVGAVE